MKKAIDGFIVTLCDKHDLDTEGKHTHLTMRAKYMWDCDKCVFKKYEKDG